MAYKGSVQIDETTGAILDPVYRILSTTTDGTKNNGEIWYRTDLNEMRSQINGQSKVLFNNLGNPPLLKVSHLTVTKTFTDFSIAETVKQVTILTLPAKGELISVTAEVTTVWDGGATVTISVGRGQTPLELLIAQDIKTTGFKDLTGTVLQTKRGMFSSIGNTDIVAEAKSTVLNLNQSTTGSITFYITWVAH